MTKRTGLFDGCNTEIARLALWTTTLASALMALSIFAVATAHAEDPKAAAEEIGQADSSINLSF